MKKAQEEELSNWKDIIAALDDYAKKLEDALDDSSKTVQESLESQKEIIAEAKDLYRTSTDAVNETMDKIVQFYSGMGMNIDGTDYTPKGNFTGSSSSTVAPSISVNAGSSNKEITEQSTEKIVNSNKQTADQIASSTKSAAEQVTGQVKSFTQILIDEMKNEKGEIVIEMGTLIPLDEVPVIDKEIFQMMSYRIAPKLKELADSMQKIQNYQVNNNQPVEIVNHYDALLKGEGNVDEKVAKLLPQQLEQTYQYMTKKIVSDEAKIGVRIRR